MLSKITALIRRLVLREKSSSEAYVAHLRRKGMKIGKGVKFYSPENTTVDEQYPWMITIGDYVRIAHGVVILTHDYSWAVLKRQPPEGEAEGAILGTSGHVKIGNNVFVGMNAIITRNVTIGNNVVIGAGSVVTRDCLDNGVYAGSPARKVMELDEFYRKRQAAQLREAEELARGYYERFGKKPEKEIFHEYFMLFADAKQTAESEVFREKMKKCDNPEASYSYLEQNKPLFIDYDAFLEHCFPEAQ